MLLRLFELLEALRPHEHAKAALLEWDGTRYVRSREVIDLYEFAGTHGDKGDRGYGFMNPASNRWEAISGLYQQVQRNAGL